MKVISKGYRLNEQIREKEIRLIGEENEQLGIVSSQEALKLAENSELDLVMIAPSAKPPVCKIMNYGKFLYEQTKRDKEARKKQKVVNIKEVRLSASIEEHDINIKANNARKFLKDEDKVKVTIRFRGRQANFSQVGRDIMGVFFSKIEEDCIVEKRPKLEGRNMIMILAPKKA
ncbi:MAG: translation initiation factor IF-3 [Clostridiaceae bacterium]